MATHFSILAWKIPWTKDPGRLQYMGLQESDMTEQLHFSWLQSPSTVILEPPKIKPLFPLPLFPLFPLFPHLFPMK